ncbi:lysoplasmalogenase [Nocardioides limicola]|uniref:lysoplasmalogenase n=1 Tax=Nocardioides limicola TaxID=2803368 RepID=UPI00193C37DE|nr:lysoplasmalogenase [Nocardioides sp. DJM-14]
MPRLSAVLKAGYVAVAAVDALLAGSASPRMHRARMVTKPLLMPLLAGSLVTAPAGSPLRTPVLAAQAAGWVGDVALLSEDRGRFRIGAGAFAVGHLAYISGFTGLRRHDSGPWQERPARALAGVWAVTAPAVIRRARGEGLAMPVAGYSLVLTSMVVTATRLDETVSARTRRRAAAGALLFLASDSILSARRFLVHDPPALMEGVVMATYTAGQFLLSESAASPT